VSAEIQFEREPGQTSDIPNMSPPKSFLVLAILLIACTFWAAVAATRFGEGKFDVPDGQIVASRSLSFNDAPDGGILVYDYNAGTLASKIEPNTNQFMRGAIRGLARSRRAMQIKATAPFVLTQWDDGRLTLDDPSTGERVAVSSFGPTQIESFRALLLAGK
jgi:putative photosynthetic complex assembly protein